MEKFIEVPKNDVNHAPENDWFQKCRIEKIPFITLKARTKYADVHWDYISYPTELDSVLDVFEDQIQDGAMKIFKNYATDTKADFSISSRLITFRNIEISKAKLAAIDLFDLINGFVNNSTEIG